MPSRDSRQIKSPLPSPKGESLARGAPFHRGGRSPGRGPPSRLNHVSRGSPYLMGGWPGRSRSFYENNVARERKFQFKREREKSYEVERGPESTGYRDREANWDRRRKDQEREFGRVGNLKMEINSSKARVRSQEHVESSESKSDDRQGIEQSIHASNGTKKIYTGYTHSTCAGSSSERSSYTIKSEPGMHKGTDHSKVRAIAREPNKNLFHPASDHPDNGIRQEGIASGNGAMWRGGITVIIIKSRTCRKRSRRGG